MECKTYQYEGFGPAIEFAESLGWVDDAPDGSDPEYDSSMADCIEQDALDFIRSKGYRVEGV